MKPNIDNIINHDHRINYHILKGVVELDLLLNYIKNLVPSPGYNDGYNILVDIREADMPDFFDRIDEFIQFFLNSPKEINWKRKCAIVTTNEKHAVISIWYKHKMEKLNFDLFIEVFSTEEAALDWLQF